jgi:hypothetical protein
MLDLAGFVISNLHRPAGMSIIDLSPLDGDFAAAAVAQLDLAEMTDNAVIPPAGALGKAGVGAARLRATLAAPSPLPLLMARFESLRTSYSDGAFAYERQNIGNPGVVSASRTTCPTKPSGSASRSGSSATAAHRRRHFASVNCRLQTGRLGQSPPGRPLLPHCGHRLEPATGSRRVGNCHSFPCIGRRTCAKERSFILDLSMGACRLSRLQFCRRKRRAVCDRTKDPPKVIIRA